MKAKNNTGIALNFCPSIEFKPIKLSKKFKNYFLEKELLSKAYFIFFYFIVWQKCKFWKNGK
jgi:hypothetical protein